ncbi:hypothetical protein KACHI17_07960 [Sediminibacterium sp. KACHI17]|jgi:hypothetical protein|uniref:Uncharacterized protein n=1 Tax=Sediminibacterium sp. KACHI17 TaxID=1751071 RepID=A0AAT9GH41_9BACT
MAFPPVVITEIPTNQCVSDSNICKNERQASQMRENLSFKYANQMDGFFILGDILFFSLGSGSPFDHTEKRALDQ